MRKRGVLNEEEPLSFERRVLLKRSYDLGDVPLYNPLLDENQAFDELLNEPASLIEYSPKLGNGVYGEVHAIKDDKGDNVAVLKITGCTPNSIGVMDSPFRSEHIEPRLLNWLWNTFVVTGVTPHIVAPFGKHAIVPVVTEYRKRQDDTVMSSLVYCMELASAHTLRHYLTCLEWKYFDEHLKVLLFQVFYTLGSIFLVYPNFRHNDLKDDNILLNVSSSTGYSSYTIYGKTYRIPHIGVTALIADFDMASISGSLFDNYKLMEQSWDTPSYSMNARKNQAIDMWTLIQFIRQAYRPKITSFLQARLEDVFGKYYRAIENKNRPHPEVVPDLPTVRELFEVHGFFDEFLLARHEAGPSEILQGPSEVYSSSRVKLPVPIPSIPTFMGEQRECPLFKPRGSPNLKITNPSIQYFSTLKIAYDLSECSSPYSNHIAKRLIRHVGKAYRVPPGPKKDDPGHGFDPELESSFMENVEAIAQDFICSFHVPYHWWCAVFTCAFVDSCYEMSIVPIGQRCWKMEEWIDFWSNCFETVYTPIQMMHFAIQWEWLRV